MRKVHSRRGGSGSVLCATPEKEESHPLMLVDILVFHGLSFSKMIQSDAAPLTKATFPVRVVTLMAMASLCCSKMPQGRSGRWRQLDPVQVTWLHSAGRRMPAFHKWQWPQDAAPAPWPQGIPWVPNEFQGQMNISWPNMVTRCWTRLGMLGLAGPTQQL